MNTTVMKQTTAGSLSGTMSFPEVVETLIGEGVESYHADLVRLEKTFYLPNGETLVEPLKFEPAPIGTEFDQEAVVSSIRAIQLRDITYTEFLLRIMKAGTTAYFVFLNGKNAMYYGRKGEFYVENFPQAANP